MDSTNDTNPTVPRMVTEDMIPPGGVKPRHLAAATTMTAGDTYYVGSDGIFHRLVLGAEGTVLTPFNGLPTWGTANIGTKITTVTSIDAKTVANTVIYTVPTNKTLYVTSLIIYTSAYVSGGKTINAITSFGGNPSAYNDFIYNYTFSFTANNQYQKENDIDRPLISYTSGTALTLHITTGSNATTETWTFELYGYFL